MKLGCHIHLIPYWGWDWVSPLETFQFTLCSVHCCKESSCDRCFRHFREMLMRRSTTSELI